MRSVCCWKIWIVCLLLTLCPLASVEAERFVLINSQGQRREVIGRIQGSGQGAVSIERRGGQLEIVAQAAILERDLSVEWQPLTPQEMAEELAEEFSEKPFRSYVEGNFVIGMILLDELPKTSETRVLSFQKKAARFMGNVQNSFLKFTKDLQLTARDPETPLVLLIFESDDDFNAYTDSVTQGQGISARNISGFYNGITNYLAIRMTECATFEVPLHEAIHQQVYNRGIFQRLAPIPAWFNEGLASGFESNSDRLFAGPTRIHSHYAERFQSARQVTWDQLVTDDLAFQGDVLAGDAYCHAWALHWLLVTKHQKAYANYVKRLSEKQALTKEDLSVRQADFAEFFGENLASLQAEFVQALQRGQRTQRGATAERQRPGYLRTQKALADLEVTALIRADRGGLLTVEGKLQNLNPFRNMTFCVTAVTDGGLFTQWVLHDVASNRTVNLPLQLADRQLGNGDRSIATFRLQVHSTSTGSPTADRWRRGDLPTPHLPQ